MPKGSPELVTARKEEIINACERLYQSKGFKEITIAEIGRETSFTRTSIYNYFQTKEEIFLALLQREYVLWIADLNNMMRKYQVLTRDTYAEKLAHSLEKRTQLLKLLSMNHYDMEEHSRQENLNEFKAVYKELLQTVTTSLEQYFPEMTENQRQEFIYCFFPFLFGIYPYTVVTEKQKDAMKKAGMDFLFLSVYDITYRCVKKLLKI